MTKVAILPVPMEQGDMAYHAVAGEKRSQGHTVGQALDALTLQFTEEDNNMLVVVQSLRPDRFFPAESRKRLEELMARRRAAQVSGGNLTSQEQDELTGLVDAELHASANRSAVLADEIERQD